MSALDQEKLHVFWGDRQHAVPLSDIRQLKHSDVIEGLVKKQGLSELIVLNQTHGNQGLCVDDLLFSSQQHWFDYQGDFLVTNRKDIALIVLTADCVPLIMYDPVHQAVSLIHAGWRGSYLDIVPAALTMMKNLYGSNAQDLVCEFGPSARACCYEVTKEFQYDFNQKHENSSLFFTLRNLKIYFDNSLFLQEMLKKFGILAQNIYTSNALCSICNSRFCSFRREKESALRQVTLVALR